MGLTAPIANLGMRLETDSIAPHRRSAAMGAAAPA